MSQHPSLADQFIAIMARINDKPPYDLNDPLRHAKTEARRLAVQALQQGISLAESALNLAVAVDEVSALVACTPSPAEGGESARDHV